MNFQVSHVGTFNFYYVFIFYYFIHIFQENCGPGSSIELLAGVWHYGWLWEHSHSLFWYPYPAYCGFFFKVPLAVTLDCKSLFAFPWYIVEIGLYCILASLGVLISCWMCHSRLLAAAASCEAVLEVSVSWCRTIHFKRNFFGVRSFEEYWLSLNLVQ